MNAPFPRAAAPRAAARPALGARLAARGLDGATLLVLPALVFVLALFIYPFAYGLVLSFRPATGGWLANYAHFLADPFEWGTIPKTLGIAVPATLVNVVLSVPVALRVRLLRRQRLLTTILVVPITLGTVLIAEGMLNYLGPQGWVNRVLLGLHLVSHPVRLVHNYWGVFLRLVITGFPFTFLLTLSYVSGVDPALENAARHAGCRRAAAASPPSCCRCCCPGLAVTFCLAFVQAFAVFPSALLLGDPAGSTRVISIAAYEAAFERYDYSYASAAAMIMAAVQVLIVGAVLALRGLLYSGPAGGGKG